MEKKKTGIGYRGQYGRGKGEASSFTELAWVKEQCQDKLGFLPYPGTVNLKVEPEVLEEFRRLASNQGTRLVSTDPNFCDALSLPVRLLYGERAVAAAVVLPLVAEYYQDILELLAPIKVTEALDLKEGTELVVELVS